MKTFYIPPEMSTSQAMQHIFLQTGRSMYPRAMKCKMYEDNVVMVYDISEPEDHVAVTQTPLLITEELAAIYKLINVCRYDTFLWHRLIVLLKNFSNQERFQRATFLQHHIIAAAFYDFAIKQSCKN